MKETKDNFSYLITDVRSQCEDNLQSYRKFVNDRCDEYNVQYDKTVETLTSMDKTIKRQFELVDSFVNNDFQRDISTGTVC